MSKILTYNIHTRDILYIYGSKVKLMYIVPVQINMDHTYMFIHSEPNWKNHVRNDGGEYYKGADNFVQRET